MKRSNNEIKDENDLDPKKRLGFVDVGGSS